MPLDPSRFHAVNVSDTCAVWNVLSSATLYSAAVAKGCTFCCTGFVAYECLERPGATLPSWNFTAWRSLKV